MDKNIKNLINILDKLFDELKKLSNEDGEILDYDIDSIASELSDFYNYIINYEED